MKRQSHARRDKTKVTVAALSLATCLGLMACNTSGEDVVYHHFQSLPTEGWDKEDTLYFEATIPDSQTYYRLTVEIRHTTEYAYRNLDISLLYPTSPTDSTGKTTPEHTDTLSLILANEEGKWNGKGWGGLYQAEFPTKNIRITTSGTYRFRLAYSFSDTTLQGLNDIGIRLQRTQHVTTSHQHTSPSGINTQEDEKQEGEPPQR